MPATDAVEEAVPLPAVTPARRREVRVCTDADPLILRAARPERDARRLLGRIAQGATKPLSQVTLAEARRALQLLVKAYGTREPVENVVERLIPGPVGPIRIRAYVPRGSAAEPPILVWFHGGGFISGDLYTAGGTARALANRSGAVVVAVDYRLAPEHDLGTALGDCLAAVSWMSVHGREVGGDPRRIAVGGDSAGGNLAALVAQECRGSDRPRIRFQALVYPATDVGTIYPSLDENASGFFLTRESIEWIKSHVATVSDLADPRFSPLLTKDLRGLPPALVVTAGFDPIRDEGLAYVDRLREAGVRVERLHYPAQIHGFLSFDRILASAGDALERMGNSLRRALQPSAPFAASVAPGPAWAHPWLDRLGLHGREAVVTVIFARDWIERTVDAFFGGIWRFWNLPSGSDVERLAKEVEGVGRKIDGLQGRLDEALRARAADADR